MKPLVTTVVLSGRLGTGKDTVANILLGACGSGISLAHALKVFTRDLLGVPGENFWGESARRSIPFPVPVDAQVVDVAAERLREPLWEKAVQEMFSHRVKAEAAATHLRKVLQPHLPIATPRLLLQLMGTEWGRELWADVWLYAVKRQVERGGAGLRVVIPDCRYPNEAAYLSKELDAKIYWIDAADRIPIVEGGHQSEPTYAQMQPYITATINNNRTLEELPSEVWSVVTDYR